MEDKAAAAVTVATTTDNNTLNTTDSAEVKPERLSAKIGNLPVVNNSLQTVSRTYLGVRESNSYVKYGLTVVESSFDKAVQAGKSVLDSSTLAPITSRACGNIVYIDKEVGAVVEKIFGSKTESKDDENEELKKNASVEAKIGIQELSNSTALSIEVLPKENSVVGYFGRKLLQLQSTPVSTRKRKERSSISEELQKFEPSPVKRKFGDRQSSSDEASLAEMIHVDENYVSEEDPDYVQPEDVPEETDDELTEGEKDEILKEAEDLKQDLKDHDVKLTQTSENDREDEKVESLELEDMKAHVEQIDQSRPKSTKDTPLSTVEEEPQNADKEKATPSDESKSDETKAETNKKEEPQKGKEKSVKQKFFKDKFVREKTVKEKSPKEKSVKEDRDKPKDEAVESKESDTNKKDKSTPEKEKASLSKSRRSSRSPLIEKLLSPGRSKSEKGKAKSEKANLENATTSENINSEKSEKEEKPKSDQNQSEGSSATMSLVSGPFEMLKMGGKK